MDNLLKRTLWLLLISALVVLLAALFGQPPTAPHPH
jgi:flagellar basal body-associated protein FliL